MHDALLVTVEYGREYLFHDQGSCALRETAFTFLDLVEEVTARDILFN